MALNITGSLDSSDLLFLPWSLPLEEWPPEYVVALPRGISRHVVRFTRIGDKVYALKEISAALADHEYVTLRKLRKLGIPCVKSIGVVKGRTDESGEELDPILITKHLPFSLPYRALFSGQLREDSVIRLADALVLLLVRLHLNNFVWRDCSLSNTLFRRDAGDFAAYLVDAETGELRETLSDGMRWYDIDTATTNIAGELMDLQAGGKLSELLDPVEVALDLQERYQQLWSLLTEPITVSESDRRQLDRHIRQLNDIGFDVGELQVDTEEPGRVRVRVKVVDADHHSRRLMRLTGMDVGENQARRLLNDMDAFRAAQRSVGSPSARDEQVCAHRWLTTVFEPVVEAVPVELVGKLEPAEVFHEVLEHRWFLSERLGYDVGLELALTSYIDEVLRQKPDEQAVLGKRAGIPSTEETQEIRLVMPEAKGDR